MFNLKSIRLVILQMLTGLENLNTQFCYVGFLYILGLARIQPQICGYAGVWIYRFEDISICAGIVCGLWICRRLDMQFFLVCRYFNMQVIGHVDMWVRRYLDMNNVDIWMCIVQVCGYACS